MHFKKRSSNKIIEKLLNTKNEKEENHVLIILLIVIGIIFSSNDGFENTRLIDMANLMVFGVLLGMLIAKLKYATDMRK